MTVQKKTVQKNQNDEPYAISPFALMKIGILMSGIEGIDMSNTDEAMKKVDNIESKCRRVISESDPSLAGHENEVITDLMRRGLLQMDRS